MERKEIVTEEDRLRVVTTIEFPQEAGLVFAIISRSTQYGSSKVLNSAPLYIEDRETAAQIAAALLEQSTAI